MQFLYPTFLWALLALAIPIIIHLFYFRRFKKVYFTNVKFLKEVKEETSSRNKLKNLLVLLMRILAVLFLVMAFAQPFLTKNNNVDLRRKAVSIFIDNSFSMNTLSQDVPLFDLAKDRAKDIVEAYNSDDRFQILTHDLEGRHQRLLSQEDALSAIEELQISPAVNNLSVISSNQQYILASEPNQKVIYWVSDFQRNIMDLSSEFDSSYVYNAVPLQAVKEQNVSLDSVWLNAPVALLNQPNELIVKVSNNGEEKVENVRLNLIYSGQEKPMGTLDVEAGGTAYDTINLNVLQTGWQLAELKITDFPIQFDDHYLMAFQVDEDVNVISLNPSGNNRYLTAAFEGLEYFRLTNQSIDRIQYNNLPNYDLVILNDLSSISSGLAAELSAFVENGGNLLLFPSLSADIENLNGFLSGMGANRLVELEAVRQEVSWINTNAFVFNNVFDKYLSRPKLPVTENSYRLTNYQQAGEETLLRYRNGKSYLSAYRYGKGFLYLSSAPLNESQNDLVRNAEIFIPMLYKMAQSKAEDTRLAYVIGQDKLIEVDNVSGSEEILYTVEGPQNFIPGQLKLGPKTLLDLNEQVKTAGYFNVYLEDQRKGTFAFNYDRKESNLDYLSVDELSAKLGTMVNLFKQENGTNFASVVGTKEFATSLWKYCLILCLIFLGLEALILRFWKT